MRRQMLSIFLTLLPISVSAPALAEISPLSSTKSTPAATDDLADCPLNAKDPFGYRAKMREGHFAGQCINTDLYRSAMRLTPEQRQSFFTAPERAELFKNGINVDDASVEVVANFAATDASDKEHFYVAVIPIDRIVDTVVQLTDLTPSKNVLLEEDKKLTKLAIFHGQIRFRRNLIADTRPIMLIDQTTVTDGREMKVLDDDIIMTVSGVKAVGHESEKYNPILGMRPGYYGEEFQLGSMHDLTTNWIVPNGLHTDEYRANFTMTQTRQALSDGITIATERGVTTPYSTFYTSCLNYIFLVFHDVLQTSDSGDLRQALQSAEPVIALKKIGIFYWNLKNSYIDTLNKPKN